MTSNPQSCGGNNGDESAVAFFLTQSPCELYAEVKRAYIALLTGNQRQRVRIHERDTWFAKADAHLLREEMNRLAEQCRAQDTNLASALGATPRAGVFSTRPFGISPAYKL